MARAIFNVFFKFIVNIVNTILLPINALLSNLFPSLASFISSVTTWFLGLTRSLTWFFSLFPPTFKLLLVTYLSFLIALYGAYFVYRGIIKIIYVIKNVKFW